MRSKGPREPDLPPEYAELEVIADSQHYTFDPRTYELELRQRTLAAVIEFTQATGAHITISEIEVMATRWHRFITTGSFDKEGNDNG